MAPTQENLGSHIPNRAVICIDAYTQSLCSGSIYYRHESVKVAFCDINALLRELEWFFDALRYPQSSVEYRSFGKRQEPSDAPKHTEMQPNHDAEPVGKLATFVIHVQFRQNATWQGRILWLEREENQEFKSALELIKLIDGALATT